MMSGMYPGGLAMMLLVRVIAAHAGDLPYDTGTFDAAFASLVLCSVPDPHVALAELHRVLRPGGELRFFEHVRSHNLITGALQAVINPLWSAVGGGCHLNRDTTTDITTAGFHITDLDRFTYPPLKFVPAHAHILGRARKIP